MPDDNDVPGGLGAPEWDRQWTDEARAAYVAALERLVAELNSHASAVRAMTGANADMVELFLANGALERAGGAYDDALFELTGTSLGWDATNGDLEEIEVDEEELGDDEVVDATAVVSILRRSDYLVTDPAAVIRAGREAYRGAWPDDGPEDVEARVDGLGRAVYELMHAAGTEEPTSVFARTPGLVPGWTVTVFAEAESSMDGEVDEPFAEDELVEIYRLTESPRSVED